MTVSEEERRWNWKQALASSRLEGHNPTPEFIADCEAVIKGTMTHEEIRARSLARAMDQEHRVMQRKREGSS